MATHDYVIANGTGAAVRSDLNNALAAIVSNNSGSSEPGTTYAYQWWADTNANVLKLRNSANNAWITLRELDGTMLIEDGSAANPGLSFASDTNSGLFGGSDVVGFSTGGTQRFKLTSTEAVVNETSNDYDFRVESNGNTHMLFVDAGNDRIGINDSSPDVPFSIKGSGGPVGRIAATDQSNARLRIQAGNTSESFLEFADSDDEDVGEIVYSHSTNSMRFRTNGSEQARIDSSGNLGVGTSSPAYKIEVTQGSGNSVARFTGANSANLVFRNATSNVFELNAGGGNDELSFGTAGNNERLRINTSGNAIFKNSEYVSFNDNGYIRTDSSGYLRLQMGSNGTMFTNSSNVEVARFDTSGRFLHGLTSPSSTASKFEVAANVGPDPAYQFTQTASSGISYDLVLKKSNYAPDDNSSRFLTCADSSADRLHIKSDGDVLNHDNSYGALSDVSLKQQIVDASSQWDDIKEVRVRKFKMNSDVEAYGNEAGFKIGVIAQELEQTSPGLVKNNTEVDGTILKSVSYSVLYMKAIKALQEAQTRIETLEAKVAALEAG